MKSLWSLLTMWNFDRRFYFRGGWIDIALLPSHFMIGISFGPHDVCISVPFLQVAIEWYGDDEFPTTSKKWKDTFVERNRN